MATQQQVKKRRLRAEQRARAQAAARTRAERRRRLMIGAVSGVLVLAMVATLGGGLFATGTDDRHTTIDDFDAADDDLPQPVVLSAPTPGATIVGPTPCPALDGSAERTTAFSEPPPACLDPAAQYDVEISTTLGQFTLRIDPSLDSDAANLFVVNAAYHAYDQMPFWFVYDVGLAIGGSITTETIDDDSPDLGFSIPTTGVDSESDDPYPPGTVAMFADLDGEISSRFVVVTDDLGGTTLALEPVHPVIGTVVDGVDVLRALIDEAGAPGFTSPMADVRILRTDITAVPS